MTGTSGEFLLPATDSEPEPSRFDPATPSTARMYDYYLGGKDHFSSDREAAERLIAAQPAVRDGAQANRRFLIRAVELLAQEGVRQFVDIGAGIPTSPNVHEVAQAVHADARVAYVDNDPVVLSHSRALRSRPGVVALEGDIRDPAAILADPALRAHIDFTQPVGLLLVAVLHFVRRDQDPARIVRELTAALAPGSFVVISSASSEGQPPEAVARFEATYAGATSPLVLHSRADIAGWLSGTELLDPGVVPVFEWRAAEPIPAGVSLFGAVGRR